MTYPITEFCGVETNAVYIIRDGDDAAVIDPCVDSDMFIRDLESFGSLDNLRLRILLTHGHEDHISGVKGLMERFPSAQIWISNEDKKWLTNQKLNGSWDTGNPIDLTEFMGSVSCFKDGDVMEIGKYKLRVMAAPGHTPGSCLFIDDENKCVFSGDVLFKETIGACHFAGGCYQTMEKTLKKMFEVIPMDYVVYPGHNEETTMAWEKEHNRFITDIFEQ